MSANWRMCLYSVEVEILCGRSRGIITPGLSTAPKFLVNSANPHNNQKGSTVTPFLQLKKLRQWNQASPQGQYKMWIGIRASVEVFWGQILYLQSEQPRSRETNRLCVRVLAMDRAVLTSPCFSLLHSNWIAKTRVYQGDIKTFPRIQTNSSYSNLQHAQAF